MSKELSTEKTMTVKEVAKALGVTDRTIRNYIFKLGKDLSEVTNSQNGRMLNESDVTLIKVNMEKNHHLDNVVTLPKTELEK